MVKFILASVMLFNFIFSSPIYAEIIDRVIAYVDNQVITLRDFEKFNLEIKKMFPDITNNEIIELMINRTLLLKEGKKLFLEGKDEEVINNYVDLRIKSKIIITDNMIREYYDQNKDKFGQRTYHSVRDEIEKYLFEKQLNIKLKEHIEELKESTEIKKVFIP